MPTRRLIFIALILIVLFLPVLSFAEDPSGFAPYGNRGLVPCDGPKIPNPPSGYVVCDFNALIGGINKLVQFMIYLAIPLSTVAFAYAGVLYMTAAGDSGKLKKAHGIFTLVGTGLIFIFAAWLIVHTIITVLVKDPSYNLFIK